MARVCTLLLLFPMLLIGCREAGRSATADSPQSQRVVIDGWPFHLEVARTPASRRRGLSDRPFIEKDGGMLFVFPEAAPRSFWMKDCLVPIDLIFLCSRGRVVATHEMTVEPPSSRSWPSREYPSGKPAAFAIELKGGTLDQLDVVRGERIELPRQDLKRRAR